MGSYTHTHMLRGLAADRICIAPVVDVISSNPLKLYLPSPPPNLQISSQTDEIYHRLFVDARE